MTPELDKSKTRNELNCRALNSTLVFLDEKFGTEKVDEFISQTGLPPSYLRDQNNWVSWSYYCHFLQALVDWTGDPAIPYTAGTYSWNKKSWGYFYYINYALGNVGGVLKKLKELVPHFNKGAEWEILSLEKNKATLRIRMKEGFPAKRLCCESRMGQFAGIPKAFGMPLGKVRELQCQAHGADSCMCVVTWHNRPTRYYGLIGVIPAIAMAYFLQQFGLLQSNDFIAVFLVVFAGYFLGRLFDFKSVMKSYKEQTAVLEESVKVIENKYLNLQKAHEGLAAVHEFSLAVTSTHNVEEVLSILLRMVVETLGFDRSVVMIADHQEGVLHRGKIYGDDSLKEFFAQIKVPLDLDSPIAHEVFENRRGQVVTLDFIQREEATETEYLIFEMTKSREYVIVPIVWKEKLLGILAADNIRSSKQITMDEKVAMESLANQAAIAIENARTSQST